MLVPDDIADVVQALVDKSLVVADRTGDRVRFTQLQTLAQYGQEKLAARGDARRVREVISPGLPNCAACGATAAAS
jgi:predicted ATPase